jgi:hypothetical protein
LNELLFKTCPCCGETWETQRSFVVDQSLRLNGYMADFEELELGLLMFTHDDKDDKCGSTMALHVQDFMNLYRGPVYEERRMGKEDCPRYCLDKENLQRCNAACECAYVRDLIQIIMHAGADARVREVTSASV